MQPYFNYKSNFIGLSFSQQYLKPLEYLVKTWKTLVWLLVEKPQVVWVQLPPTILLHLLFVYRLLLNQRCLIIADCHNASLRRPWIDIPGFKVLLRRCDIVLVHNDTIKQQGLELDIPPHKLYTLEDPPASIDPEPAGSCSKEYPRPWLLCPCSFNKDEPISEIFEAARLAPEITFVLTGNVAKAAKVHGIGKQPNNVVLPGFLPTQEFDELLHNADIIMGLTLLDGIQLSVANEAVGAGQPMVLAATNTLKTLFHKGAVYADPKSSNAIASGCREAVQNHSMLQKAVKELRTERQQAWSEQANTIKKILVDAAK